MSSKYSGPITSYQNAVADQSRLWIPVPIITAAVSALRNIGPSTQAGRQQVLETVATLIPAQPYAIIDGQTQVTDLRFGTVTNAGTPITANSYVACFRGGWSAVLRQLQSAADFSARINEKGVGLPNTTGQEMPDSTMMRLQFNDATVALRQAVLSADRLLSNCTGMYNYHTFETGYQLTWSTASEPKTGPTDLQAIVPITRQPSAHPPVSRYIALMAALDLPQRQVLLGKLLDSFVLELTDSDLEALTDAMNGVVLTQPSHSDPGPIHPQAKPFTL